MTVAEETPGGGRWQARTRGHGDMPEKPAKMRLLPGAAGFYLNTPLYMPYAFDDSQIEAVINIISFRGPFDCYCIECRQPSVFHTMESSGGGAGLPGAREPTAFFVRPTMASWARTSLPPQSYEIHTPRFHCTRNDKHVLVFVLRLDGQTIEKVGQYPSLADLVTAEIRKYQKLLGADAYREFSKAIGLSSHGVGIGAFVYLRRIIENLIEEAHQVAQTSEGWTEATYTDSRVDKRIRLLKELLPPFLVENSALYSILSKGLHELSEQECLAAFPLMRVSIELILDQKLEKQEREGKIARAKQEIAELRNHLKKDGRSPMQSTDSPPGGPASSGR